MLSVIAWTVTIVLAVPLAILCAELATGLGRRPEPPHVPSPDDCPQIDILMPAHNEATGIAGIIQRLKGELASNVRLIVVADNCSDETASVARDGGAIVLERFDPEHRGKGHALAFGRDWLRSDPPGCVIVLDADCTVEPGAIGQLAAAALGQDRPVQGCYLLHAQGEGPMVQLSNFAFFVKNAIRQRGSARLGSAAVLGGTGMAFPWPLFAEAPLATSDLVEDLALGVHFTMKGKPPLFMPGIGIWSEAAAAADTLTQRTRWEHGFIDTARRQALPLVRLGLVRRDAALFGLGLHLLVPPLALLMSLSLAGLVFTSALALIGASLLPVLLLATLIVSSGLLIMLAWRNGGEQMVPASTLLRVPLYLLWKLPVYVRLLYRRQTEWLRTGRKS